VMAPPIWTIVGTYTLVLVPSDGFMPVGFDEFWETFATKMVASLLSTSSTGAPRTVVPDSRLVTSFALIVFSSTTAG